MKKIILLITFISVLIMWEIMANAYPTIKFFISSPKESAFYFFANFQDILYSTLITSIEALSGFFIAIFFSFLFMYFCLLYPPLLRIILPIFITSQILPIITLAPLFIILFGMGLLSKIAMVVLMCFFPIFINFSAGVKSISNTTNELLYIYNARKAFRIFQIIIPLSTPYIFTGLKVSTTMAIMGAIVAEFVGARDGLGKNLYLAPKSSLPELMICSIILITLLGWILFILFKSVQIYEMKIGKWYLNQKP